MGVLYSYTVVFTVGLCEDCPDDCYNAFPMAHNKLHCSPPTLQTDREDRQTDRQTDRQRSDVIRRTVLQTVARKSVGHGHQSQRHCPCNAQCPPAIALVITLQVGKMRAPRTFAPHFTRCHTRSPQPRRPAFYYWLCLLHVWNPTCNKQA